MDEKEKGESQAIELLDKHYTTLEWETDVEYVRVTFYVERFPKDSAAADSARAAARSTPDA
jgi:hypothetical protein